MMMTEPGFQVQSSTLMEPTKQGRHRVAFRFALDARNAANRQDELWAVPAEEQEALREADVFNMSIFLSEHFGLGYFETSEPGGMEAAWERLRETDEGDSFLWSFSLVSQNGGRLDVAAEELDALGYLGADREQPPERSLLSCFAKPLEEQGGVPTSFFEPSKWTGDCSDKRGRRRLAFVSECDREDVDDMLEDLGEGSMQKYLASSRRQRRFQQTGFWDLSLFRCETIIYGFCSADAPLSDLYARYLGSDNVESQLFFDEDEPLEVPRSCYVGADRLELRVALVGCGWWAQGWHLPHLLANAETRIVALVDPASQTKSIMTMSVRPNLESRDELATRYDCEAFEDLESLLNAREAGLIAVDAVVIASPHSTHCSLAQKAVEAGLHVFCEKPLCTSPEDAREMMRDLAEVEEPIVMVNHTANFRVRSILARELVSNSKLLGRIKHCSCEMYSPLAWIFEDPKMKNWNEPRSSMLGNGFMWGQMSHTLAWIFFVTDLEPLYVFARTVTSEATGADVYDAVSVRCKCGAILNLNGIATIPGESSPKLSSSKLIRNTITGTDGYMTYSGFDGDFESGGLVLKRHDLIADAPSDIEVSRWRELGFEVDDDDRGMRMMGFEFEDGDPEGTGPSSLQTFVDAALGRPHVNCANVRVAAMAVFTIEAAYRSALSGKDERVDDGTAAAKTRSVIFPTKKTDDDDAPPPPPPV